MEAAKGIEMKSTALAKAAGALIGAASFLAPAAVVAAPAHADPKTQEFYFIQYLDQKGIPYGRKMDAIRIAKQVCLKVSRPGNPGIIGYFVHQDLHEELGLNGDQSEMFIEASIYQYCPQVWHINGT